MERNNYEQMTVSVLKQLARTRGKTRHCRLNKAGLNKNLSEPTPPRKPTREDLRGKLNIRGYSKLNKAELIVQLKHPRPLEYTRAQLGQLARERYTEIL